MDKHYCMGRACASPYSPKFLIPIILFIAILAAIRMKYFGHRHATVYDSMGLLNSIAIAESSYYGVHGALSDSINQLIIERKFKKSGLEHLFYYVKYFRLEDREFFLSYSDRSLSRDEVQSSRTLIDAAKLHHEYYLYARYECGNISGPCLRILNRSKKMTKTWQKTEFWQ